MLIGQKKQQVLENPCFLKSNTSRNRIIAKNVKLILIARIAKTEVGVEIPMLRPELHSATSFSFIYGDILVPVIIESMSAHL